MSSTNSCTMTTTCVKKMVVSSQSSAAASLKIPTVQAKFIKFTTTTTKTQAQPTVVPQPASAMDQKIPTTPSSLTAREIAPLFIEKTCGLFDFIVDDPTESRQHKKCLDHDLDPLLSSTAFSDLVKDVNFTFSDYSKVGKSDLDMMENNMDDFLAFDFSESQMNLQFNNNKKTFAQKLNEANLKIKIIKPDFADEGSDLDLDTPMNLNLDDTDLSKIMTPGTEKLCMQFLHSIPPATASEQPPPPQQSARIITNHQLLSSVGMSESELEKIILTPPQPKSTTKLSVVTNPFEAAMAANLSLQDEVAEFDHMYSQQQKKRRQSSVFDSSAEPLDSDVESEMSISTSGEPSSKRRRHRSRGIYRAEDIQTEADLANYLERRKKNNISSKISRANKKNYYTEIDAKAQAVEDENRRMAIKIEKYEKLNQLMKDYLKDAFVKNLK